MSWHSIGVPGSSPRLMISVSGSDPADQLQDGEVIVETDDKPGRVTISADGLSLEPYVIPLTELKATKWAIVKKIRDIAVAGGCDTAKGRLDTNDAARLTLRETVDVARNDPLFTISWTMLDNSVVVHNAGDIIAAGVAVGKRNMDCHQKAADYRASINAATTADELDAIDITQSWPD